MRLIACCQPSGVARSQEMRERLPLSSFLWHVPHFSMTSLLVTGMPSSLGGLGFGGSCASAMESAAAPRTIQSIDTAVLSNEIGVIIFGSAGDAQGSRLR